MAHDTIKFAFFGTSHIAVYVLDALHNAGLLPAIIIAPPDKPQGRGLEMTRVAVSLWAHDHHIPLLHELNEDFYQLQFDVCIVVDYGKILPIRLLDLPRKGFLNVHPSLLPRLRGASPIRSAILTDEKNTGVTIMLVDEELDHGPIVAQKKVNVPKWPPHLADLERILMQEGGRVLAEIMPLWVRSEIEAHPQNHDIATISKKIKKEDGLLDLSGTAYANLLKVRAFEGWPGTFVFFERNGKKIRAKIVDVHISNDELVIDRVVPEGKKEMSYREFARSGAVPVE